MYVNAELRIQYAIIVDDIRKSAKYVLARDISLRMFLITTAHSQRFNPRPLNSHTHQTLTARCEDGVHLGHIISSETGHLNLGELEKSETLLTTLADCIYTMKCAAFDMNMIKLWIPNYLDKTLNQLDKALSTEEQCVKDIENKFIVKSLRKLEELEEWVVINEVDVMDRKMVNANLMVSSDDNDVAFFGHFNEEAMYHSFLQPSLGSYNSDSGDAIKSVFGNSQQQLNIPFGGEFDSFNNSSI
ncbi:hypothetical protein HDU80_001697 [Chytriomyces hyalinus]|nr:hypothetical protein HDU80_001697 [Chytriomyces hyalinus]